MLSKKSLLFGFAVAFLFVAVSTVSAQSADDLMSKFYDNLPENCQDAIKWFPENLRAGWERGYMSAIGAGQLTDDRFLSLLQSSLMANFIKTNIILKGKGNEKIADSGVTYAQYYPQLKVGPLGAATLFRMLTAMTGNSGGINWDKWEQDFMAFL